MRPTREATDVQNPLEGAASLRAENQPGADAVTETGAGTTGFIDGHRRQWEELRGSPLWHVATLCLLVSAAILASACSDKKEPAPAGPRTVSCGAPKLRSCREYPGLGPAEFESMKKTCNPAVGDFLEGPCPTTDAIATCTTKDYKQVYYKDYTMTAEQMEGFCKNNQGTFSAK